ncbi:hypothetical protein ACFL1H_00045 [Nanoarchaeota archaeon]
MKKIITAIILVFIVLTLIIGGCNNNQSSEVNSNSVTDDDSITMDECVEGIKAENPDKTAEELNDYCYTVLAMDSGDASYCDKASDEFKQICLEAMK